MITTIGRRRLIQEHQSPSGTLIIINKVEVVEYFGTQTPWSFIRLSSYALHNQTASTTFITFIAHSSASIIVVQVAANYTGGGRLQPETTIFAVATSQPLLHPSCRNDGVATRPAYHYSTSPRFSLPLRKRPPRARLQPSHLAPYLIGLPCRCIPSPHVRLVRPVGKYAAPHICLHSLVGN